MARYIDADKFKVWFDNHYDDEEFTVGYIVGILEEQPTADVRENVHGKWIYYETENDRYDEIKCPFCKKTYTVDAYRIDDIGFTATDFNFCPNCGADMRGNTDAP